MSYCGASRASNGGFLLFHTGTGRVLLTLTCNTTHLHVESQDLDAGEYGPQYQYLEYECYLPNNTTIASVMENEGDNVAVQESYGALFEQSPLPEATRCLVQGCYFNDVELFTYFFNVTNDCVIGESITVLHYYTPT